MDDEFTIYFARGGSCTRITREAATQVEELETDHEEADSKIAYLINHALDTLNDLSEICVR